jgi:hypothetical protein
VPRCRYTRGEDESLAGGQLGSELAQAAHIVTTGQAPGHVGGWIGKGSDGQLLLFPVLGDRLAHGIVSRGLDRATLTKSALAIG